MTAEFDASREARRASRGEWPIARFRLGEEPLDDLSAVTTAAERIAMMRAIAHIARLRRIDQGE
jgi:hypothetical protein